MDPEAVTFEWEAELVRTGVIQGVPDTPTNFPQERKHRGPGYHRWVIDGWEPEEEAAVAMDKHGNVLFKIGGRFEIKMIDTEDRKPWYRFQPSGACYPMKPPSGGRWRWSR